jgi:hypothetical protein
MQPRIEIPLAKGKSAFHAVGGLMLSLFGVLLLFVPATESVMAWTGAGMALLGAFMLYIGGRQLIEHGPGLVIDAQGITENTRGMAVRHLPWAQVAGFDMRPLRIGYAIHVLAATADRGKATSRMAIDTAALRMEPRALLELLERQLATHGRGASA